jgi:hypothetical protein
MDPITIAIVAAIVIVLAIGAFVGKLATMINWLTMTCFRSVWLEEGY